MPMNGGTAHHCTSQSTAAAGHAPADWTGLVRALLDLGAQGAVLFSTWFLF